MVANCGGGFYSGLRGGGGLQCQEQMSGLLLTGTATPRNPSGFAELRVRNYPAYNLPAIPLPLPLACDTQNVPAHARQCGGQPIMFEPFATRRGSPRGADLCKSDGLVRGGGLTRGHTVRRNPALSLRE